MPKDLLRAESNERVDLTDYTFSNDTSIQDNVGQVPAEFLTDPDGTRTWIVDGFEATNAGSQVTVTRGRAILAQRRGSQIVYGAVTTEGDDTKIIDVSTFAGPATYGVYVRFEYVDGEDESRVFWDATGAGTEFTQTIPTRRLANWSMRIEATSPGTEWTKVADVDAPGGTVTDTRDLYFEGDVTTSYANVWGSGTDRDTDRQANGIKDLQTFTAAMRQCMEDIKGRGLRRWWEAEIGGMRIGFAGDPTEDRLELANNQFYLDGAAGGGDTPTLNFDANDKLFFDRTGNTLELEVGGSTILSIDGPAASGSLIMDRQIRAREQSAGVNYVQMASFPGQQQLLSFNDEGAKTRLNFYSVHDNSGSPLGSLGFNFLAGPDGGATLLLAINESGNTTPGTTLVQDLGVISQRWRHVWGDKFFPTQITSSAINPTNVQELVARTANNGVLAWGNVTWDGVSATISTQRWNVSSVVRNGAGDVTINFVQPVYFGGGFNNQVTMVVNSVGNTFTRLFFTCDVTGAAARVRVWDEGAGVAATSGRFSFTVIGQPSVAP